MNEHAVAVGVALLAGMGVMLAVNWAMRSFRSLPSRQEEMVALMAGLAAVAQAHREICRMLIADGRHSECPWCHPDAGMREWVANDKQGWMHMVSLAQHRSWLDWDVHISRIVIDQFRKATGGE